MQASFNWRRGIYFFGVACLIIGAIDPLEGSVVIALGIVLIAAITYFTNDRHRHLFRASAILIVIGVAFLFYLSSLGGFGSGTGLSPWLGILILPYPIGWMVAIVVLAFRLIQKIRRNRQ